MFQFYPKTLYLFNDFDYQKVVDLNVSAQISDYVKSYRGSPGVRQYIVSNGERPEVISYKLYGTTKYDYLLLIFNEIESFYDEWPRDDQTLKKYIEKKYGSISAANSVGYWYNSFGDQVSEAFWNTLTDPNKYTKTFYEYEIDLNDEKAKINVFDISLAVRFESNLQELFENL